ncbi:MAG: TerB family tellurite resistance protein [Yoonia sp.]
MLSDFFQKFKKQPKGVALPELDAELAMGVLLVRLAKADQHYAVEEIARIDRLFVKHRAMNVVEAAKTRATCEKLEAEAPDTDTLTQLVTDHLTHAHRMAMLTALWQVSVADGVVREEEACFVAHVAKAIGLSAEEVKRTRPADA